MHIGTIHAVFYKVVYPSRTQTYLMLKHRPKKPKKKIYSLEELGRIFSRALKYQEEKDYQSAEKYYQIILLQVPNHADSLHYLGLLKYKNGNNQRAIKLIQQAIKINTLDADYLYNLGIILAAEKMWEQASKSYKKAISLSPNYAMAYNNLSILMQRLGDETSWKNHCKTAYSLAPNSLEIINSYANYLQQTSNIFAAIKELQRGLLLDAKNGLLLASLAKFLCMTGNSSEASDYLTRLPLNAHKRPENSHLKLLCLHYNDKMSPEVVFKNHLEFGELCSEKQTWLQQRKANTHSEKNLRIAYISPDFRFHSVAYFIEPILRNHHREHFTVFCYSNLRSPDKTTEMLKKNTDYWRDVYSLCDEELMQLIINDKIDILVDLAGYTAGNRLSIFTHRITPIQITYLGYPNTTGLKTMDYRITDHWADPVGTTEHLYTEKLARLNGGFLCYKPSDGCPDVSKPPMCHSGYITFGSFNNLAKLNDSVVELWCSILQSIENSKIQLKSKIFLEQEGQDFTYARFKKHGIHRDRVLLREYAPDYVSHMSAYREIDIALDPFPYNGTTTTCEALWMGVPVVALQGDSHAARVSTSILNKLGLKHLIATDQINYKKIAITLANDEQKLCELREKMRETMNSSKLTDGKEFTLELEKLYKKMWFNFMKSSRESCSIDVSEI